jgi:hypothetical protein
MSKFESLQIHSKVPNYHLLTMSESSMHAFEVTLRECAQILSLAPNLPIDYQQLVKQMVHIAGASNYLLIHVADITHLSPLHGFLAGSYWYSIVDQIAQLFIEGDRLILIRYSRHSMGFN